jgi:hypothetical protein
VGCAGLEDCWGTVARKEEGEGRRGYEREGCRNCRRIAATGERTLGHLSGRYSDLGGACVAVVAVVAVYSFFNSPSRCSIRYDSRGSTAPWQILRRR